MPQYHNVFTSGYKHNCLGTGISNQTVIGEFNFELDHSLAFQVAQLVQAPRWAPDVVTFVQDKVSHGQEVLLEFSLKAREITKT